MNRDAREQDPTSGLVPRRVKVDFTGVRADWNAVHPEFGHLTNAMSLMLPFMEPFFIRTMRAAKEMLPPGPSPLKRDIDLFNFQEGRHYSNHARLNDVIRAGHPGPVTAAEERLRADYQRFWDRGHRFALAYTEGFETVAPMLCDYFFGNLSRFGLDRGEPAAYLWLWHVAEEHEHRTVANYVYDALYGAGRAGYWYRVYGVLFATWHVFAVSLPVAARTLRTARQRMTARQRLRSRARNARLLVGMFGTFLPLLALRACRPGYDPADLEPHPDARALLDEAQARFGVVTLRGDD